MTAASPRRLLAGAAIVLALPALGTVAYAAAHAVSNNPAPQRVIPIDTRSRVEDSTDTTDLRGPEAEPGDDRGDDNVTTRATSPTVPAATHDAGDDHGGATTVSDDGPNHDLGDDHGGSSNTTAPAEDHSGSGSSNSGRGSDDSGHHGGDG